jgi:hypothetical protein
MLVEVEAEAWFDGVIVKTRIRWKETGNWMVVLAGFAVQQRRESQSMTGDGPGLFPEK